MLHTLPFLATLATGSPRLIALGVLVGLGILALLLGWTCSSRPARWR